MEARVVQRRQAVVGAAQSPGPADVCYTAVHMDLPGWRTRSLIETGENVELRKDP